MVNRWLNWCRGRARRARVQPPNLRANFQATRRQNLRFASALRAVLGCGTPVDWPDSRHQSAVYEFDGAPGWSAESIICAALICLLLFRSADAADSVNDCATCGRVEPGVRSGRQHFMFEALFGPEMPLAARFFLAFLVVLGLIGGAAYLVRRFGADRLGTTTARGRQPRLAVIDAAPVDSRRRLVLIRRDNVEHLLLIGGPSDVVVEPNIVRAASARDTQPARAATPAEPGRGAAAPADNTLWPLQPEPARPARATPVEDAASWPLAPQPEQPTPRIAATTDPLA